MKRFFEPVIGSIISFLSYAAWTDFLVSLFVAFVGGGLAYLGKWVAAKIIRCYTEKRNVFQSKTRQAVGRYNSPDDDETVIF